jgi:hypothetical protein
MLTPLVRRGESPRLWSCAFLLAAIFVGGCSHDSDLATASVTERQLAIDASIALLEEVAEAAIARDFDALCSNAASETNCRTQLDGFMDRAPSEMPTIDCVRIFPAVDDRRSGVLIVVSGMDGFGVSYRSDFLAISTGKGEWKAMTTVFWSNIGIADQPVAEVRESPGSVRTCD